MKVEGKTTEHEIGDRLFTVLLHNTPMKVEVPEALLVDVKATTKCMEEMSQRAWEHISTGPLFLHFFNKLFADSPVKLPATIKELLEDYDAGVIHACGLIVLLVEAVLEGKTKVFVKNPETHLHPKEQRHLATVIQEIMGLGGGGDERQPTIA